MFSSHFYFGTIPTKSRTVFSSGTENAFPFWRLNQNALEEPPSRLRARCILKLVAKSVARIFDRSASVTSEQNPNAARLPAATATKVLRAGRVDSRPPTDSPRSTTIGPHSTAASIFGFSENSPKREI